MKRALLAAIMVIAPLSTGPAIAQQTDYQCLSDCQAAGYLYRFCKEKCSFGDSNGGIFPQPAPPRIDYKCQADCLGQGYRLQYCKQLCSY